MPRPGPGLVSIMNSTDLPASVACWTPSGESTPWLIALFRNSTLAGSTKIEASGSTWLLTRVSTPLPSQVTSLSTTGPIASLPRTAMAPPMMPAEKLSISISKPDGTLSWMALSTFLMMYAASGPMIMAPRNMGTSEPTMTPIVATAPTTAPRCPWTMRPPV